MPTERGLSNSSSIFPRKSNESAFWSASTSRKRTGNFSSADITERGFWEDYRNAYEECISATSTKNSPWYVVPADDKENARLIVSQIVLDTLDDLKMDYPKASDARRKELLAIRKRLEK